MYKVNYLKPKKKGYAKHTASFMRIEDAIFWEQHVMKNLKAVDTTITVHLLPTRATPCAYNDLSSNEPHDRQASKGTR